jgi:photoactive yellow protein
MRFLTELFNSTLKARSCNTTLSRKGLAGLTKEQVARKNFFKHVAPCTDVQKFYGRFRDGVAAGKLHCKFRYHFAFEHKPVDVTVTLFYGDRDKTVWVFVQPLESGK